MNQGKVRALPKAVWVTNDKKRDARNLIYEKEASGTKEGTRIAMHKHTYSQSHTHGQKRNGRS